MPLTDKKEILSQIEMTASQGLRTLGFCLKEENELGEFKDYDPIKKTPAKVH